MKKMMFATMLTLALTALLCLAFNEWGAAGGRAASENGVTFEGGTSLQAAVLPYQAIDEERVFEFLQIMCNDGYCREVPSVGTQVIRYYYAKTGEGEFLIAETFGFPEEGCDFVVDIDGDGVSELLGNVCWGDGAERVLVYRLRDGLVEVGKVDMKLYDDAGAIFNSIIERYDATSRSFRVTFATWSEPNVTVTWEWNDISIFAFEPFFDPNDEEWEEVEPSDQLFSLAFAAHRTCLARDSPNPCIARFADGSISGQHL